MADQDNLGKAERLAESVKDAPRYVLVTVAYLIISMTAMAACWHLGTLLVALLGQAMTECKS